MGAQGEKCDPFLNWFQANFFSLYPLKTSENQIRKETVKVHSQVLDNFWELKAL